MIRRDYSKGIEDFLSAQISQIEVSKDGKYYITEDVDGFAVKLELPEYCFMVNNDEFIVIETPVRTLDMSFVIGYEKLEDNKVRIYQVALNSPFAAEENYQDVVLRERKGVSDGESEVKASPEG